jgi:hypothetical protein
MLANPDIGVTQIAHRLGVYPATLYRYIPRRAHRESSRRVKGGASTPGAICRISRVQVARAALASAASAAGRCLRFRGNRPEPSPVAAAY